MMLQCIQIADPNSDSYKRFTLAPVNSTHRTFMTVDNYVVERMFAYVTPSIITLLMVYITFACNHNLCKRPLGKGRLGTICRKVYARGIS